MAKPQNAQQAEERDDGLREKMVSINRVTKGRQGGRILGFAALTVVGDGDGSIGMGKGKSREVPVAVQKAMDEARRKMAKGQPEERHLHHTVIGRHGASTVLIQPAPKGTGIIAGGAMRAVFDVMGCHQHRRQRRTAPPTPTTSCAPRSMGCWRRARLRKSLPSAASRLKKPGVTTMADKKNQGHARQEPDRHQTVAPRHRAWPRPASPEQLCELQDTPAVRGMINKVSTS